MNPIDFIKNFKDIQNKMKDIQEKVKDITAAGTAGGDMVRITIDGKMNMLDVVISPEVVDSSDIPMLQDLIKAAFANALSNLQEKMGSEISSLTGGTLPPGFPGV